MVRKNKASEKSLKVVGADPSYEVEQENLYKYEIPSMINGIVAGLDRSIKERQELDKKGIEKDKESIERKKRIAEKRAKRLAEEAEEEKSLDKGIKSDTESDEEKPPAAIDKSSSPPKSKKSINVYKLSKTAEIKVPDKVIDINNGRIKLVDTLDDKGDINKVDGHKVIDIVSYIPDSVKDSKIKVKQGSNSDISKEIKKLEGKIKRSKKPATIEKLNTELNNLLEKVEVI